MPAICPNGSREIDATATEPTVSVAAERDQSDTALSADDRLLAELAQELRDRRLAPLAVLWLESFRPLTFLGSQALQAVAPLCDVFFPRLPLARLAGLIEDRGNLDRFLAYLGTGADTGARRTDTSDEPEGLA